MSDTSTPADRQEAAGELSLAQAALNARAWFEGNPDAALAEIEHRARAAISAGEDGALPELRDDEIIAIRKATRYKEYLKPWGETLMFARALLRRQALAARAQPAATPPASRIERLQSAVEGELDGLAITHEQAAAVLAHLDADTPPDAGVREALAELLDAVDAAYPAAKEGHAAQVAWAERRAAASKAARAALAAHPTPPAEVEVAQATPKRGFAAKLAARHVDLGSLGPEGYRPPAAQAAPVDALPADAGYEAWFLGEQGKPYDGMWSFGRAAWHAAQALVRAQGADHE